MHPLFSAAVSRPGLVLEHASAYAELASVELEEAIARHRSHFVLVVVMWLLVCLAFALLSVSFMFHVAMNDTLAQSQALLLWLPPALPATGALACSLWLRGLPKQPAFQQLLGQVQQDMDWLRAQEASHG